MKIAVFHHLPEGGAKIALYEAVKRLQVKYTIHLYSFMSDEGEYDVKHLSHKVFLYPYEAIAPEKRRGIFRILGDLQTFTTLRKIHKEIAQMIDKGDYDLVYVHHSRLTQAPFLLRYLNTPSVYYCQEPLRIAYEHQLRLKEKVSLLKQIYEKLNRLIRKKIDRENAVAASEIITSSKYVSKYIFRVYGKKARICPLGVDVDKFKALSNNKREGILFIGEKSDLDGFNLLEKSITLIPKGKKPKLTIIEPFASGQFQRKKEDIISAYLQAQATICTAIREPFGLIPLESMACETPVIAVKEGGYKETILNNKTGYLIKRNAHELADKIIKLTENDKLVRRMGKAGRIHVQNNWTWDMHVENLERIFKKVSSHAT